jgi:uncharacterized protein YndB with AHSA1/START domain
MASTSSRWWLTQDRTETVVGAPAERIYDLVADLPRMGEWSPECQRVEWQGAADAPAAGATFLGHNRGGPRGLMKWSRKGRVLVADRGREFAFVTEEGGHESTVWRYTFESVDGGTKVTESYEVKRIPAWARIVDVPTNRAKELREGMTHTLARLKSTAEVRDGAGRS